MNEIEKMNENHEIKKQVEIPPADLAVASAMNTAAQLDMAARLGEIMASSRVTVPKHLQGNSGDCTAIALQALQWGMNPFAVAQKTHLVNGTLGYESQLVNSVITSSGALRTAPEFIPLGDWDAYRESRYAAAHEAGCGVTVRAVLHGEIEPRELSLCMVNATTRNSPLWKSNPFQQLCYLALKYFARLYAPAAILGVYTPDELAEPGVTDITAAQTPENRPQCGKSALAEKIRKMAEKQESAGGTVETKPDFFAAIESELKKSGAPLTMAEIESWLISGGVLPDGKNLKEDWAALNAKWRERMESDPAKFVAVAAEKILTK